MNCRRSKIMAVLVFGLLSVLGSQVFAHPGGNHNTAPVEACAELKKAAACSYSNHEGDLYKGTCRVFSETLLCVRNEPIIKATPTPSVEALYSEKAKTKVKNKEITTK